MRVRVIGERRKQQVLLYCTFCTERLHFAGTLLHFRICSSKRKHITSILHRIPLPGFYLQPVLFDSRQLHPVPWPWLCHCHRHCIAFFLSLLLQCYLYSTDSHGTAILGIFPKDTAIKSKPRVTKSWGPCCQTRDPLTRLLFHLAPAILDVPSNPCASWSCVAASDSPPARPELPLAIKEPTRPADQVDRGGEA